MTKRPVGWRRERARHSLAARGIKTGRKTCYHAARKVPKKIVRGGGNFGGFHCGTKKAAVQRVERLEAVHGPTTVSSYEVGKYKLKFKKPYRLLDERDGKERTEKYLIEKSPKRRQELIDEGYDVVPYINGVEDKGSTSYMVLDPKIVSFIEKHKLGAATKKEALEDAKGSLLTFVDTTYMEVPEMAEKQGVDNLAKELTESQIEYNREDNPRLARAQVKHREDIDRQNRVEIKRLIREAKKEEM